MSSSPSLDWQKYFLWPQTYKAWLQSDLPLLVVTYEDLVESPLTHIMQIVNFLMPVPDRIDYECAMEMSRSSPQLVYDYREITGIYSKERRRINRNIDELVEVARTKYPGIVKRLESYRAYSAA
ncbi:uncharacterized protein LOC118478225 [Aplysia californica]|uniref:Uncharacterized protein LOC118478225 n=1 Tax=Aplysia californica TaxID=6500 RepID=A0ABM1VXZ1_APLCA|nr:uncharacterized protein LOC118478225 [Aplysia californica]